MTSKRQSMMPSSQAGPKPPVHLSSSITIHDSAHLTGTHQISVSSESVVHPRARLDSKRGPIAIGRRCIVHERVHIGAATSDGSGEGGGVTTGDYVTIETGAVIETGGTRIGDGTSIGPGCIVGRGASIGKHCTLLPQTTIAAGENVPDSTVILAGGMRRQDKRPVPAEQKNKAQARQIEALRKVIPSNSAKFQ